MRNRGEDVILSVSRRTDIPAFYLDWFIRRLDEGHVLIRNPVRPRQVARVSLDPAEIEGIVFWTKNPAPLLARRARFAEMPYYVQCTITAYGADIEPGIPDKMQHVIPHFQQLSDAIGPHRMLWRYDPILINGCYTADRHIDTFTAYARALEGYAQRCVISFVDAYQGMQRHAAALALKPIGPQQMVAMASAMADIAGQHGMTVEACAEAVDLSACGVSRGKCVDAALLSRIAGVPVQARAEKGQRPACGCDASIDIGAYDTCPGGCLYCYATRGGVRVPGNVARHDPLSPMLTGWPGEGDQVYDRQLK